VPEKNNHEKSTVVFILAESLSSFQPDTSTDLLFLNDFIPKFEKVAHSKRLETVRLFNRSDFSENLRIDRGSQAFLFCDPILVSEPHIRNSAYIWHKSLPDKNHPLYNYLLACLTAAGSFFFLNKQLYEQAKRFVFLADKFILTSPEKTETSSEPSPQVYIFPPVKATESLHLPGFQFKPLTINLNSESLFKKTSIELIAEIISEPGILLYLFHESFDYLINFFILKGFSVATTNPIVAQTFKGSVYFENMTKIPDALKMASRVKKTEGLKFDDAFLDYLNNKILEHLTRC
jgi:hypothetical protein